MGVPTSSQREQKLDIMSFLLRFGQGTQTHLVLRISHISRKYCIRKNGKAFRVPEHQPRGYKSRSIPFNVVKFRLWRTKYSHIPCQFKYYKTLVLF